MDCYQYAEEQQRVLWVKNSYTDDWLSLLNLWRHQLVTYRLNVPDLAEALECFKERPYRASRMTDLFTVVVESGREDFLRVILERYPQYTETLFCASLRVLATVGLDQDKEAIYRATTVHEMIFERLDKSSVRKKFLTL